MTDSIQKPIEDSAELPRYVRIGLLFDLYGVLLTKKQRTFVQLHFDEDYSFGEISKQHGVSRQAVHDAVKHAQKSLESYESKLGLLQAGLPHLLENIGEAPIQDDGNDTSATDAESQKKIMREISKDALRRSIAAANPAPASSASQPATETTANAPAVSAEDKTTLQTVREGLEAVQQKIQRSGGIIYDADGLAKEIRRLHTQVCEALGADV